MTKVISYKGVHLADYGAKLIQQVIKQTGKTPKEREIKIWHQLKPTRSGSQLKFMQDKRRWKIAIAGRRSGKTFGAARCLVLAAYNKPGNYVVAAPSYNQVTRIYWKLLLNLTLSSTHKKKPSETNKTIFLNNGSEISLLSLDAPERLDGAVISGMIADEIADAKDYVFGSHILPALMTESPLDPDYKPFCMFIGVPSGVDNHFYDIVNNAKKNPDDWGVYEWSSSDLLDEQELLRVKSMMSELEYQTEFEAKFLNQTGRLYEQFDDENESKAEYNGKELLLWCHDFNYLPMSSAVVVKRNESYHVIDEVILDSASSRQSALEFVEKFKDAEFKQVLVFGDPAGKAGEIHNQKSNFTEIESVLSQHGWSFKRKVASAAPRILARQNMVRGFIKSAIGERRLFVNRTKAPVTWKGFSTVSLKRGSSFIEEQTYNQHVTTAVGYMLHYLHNTESEIKPIDSVLDISVAKPMSFANSNRKSLNVR